MTLAMNREEGSTMLVSQRFWRIRQTLPAVAVIASLAMPVESAESPGGSFAGPMAEKILVREARTLEGIVYGPAGKSRWRDGYGSPGKNGTGC